MNTHWLRIPTSFLLTLGLALGIFASSLSAQNLPAGKNRLSLEKSPYLQQHAENPVDWFPWGTEAFEKAQREDKPIFLSIGYSTCHWCHVMERESFSNPEIAALLNRNFVSIKVDREERPDIDQLYMAFVQASTGRGGWPLNVFLTSDLKPFFGGTYFAPDDRPGLASFPAVLQKVTEEWGENRDRILTSANRITDFLRDSQKTQPTSQASEELFHAGFRGFQTTFDKEFGGFGRAPKFPRVSTLIFLHRYARAYQSPEALRMSVRTLEKMAVGGIHDQVGGGFHRYSTDERWFLPHFEKMLYDQAQLARAYLEAFRLTGRSELGEVARGLIKYVLRDLHHPEGGFYSAEDADSVPASKPALEHKVEGAFYVWTAAELRSLLGGDFDAFSARFGIRAEGNVEKDPFGEFKQQNVLFRPSNQIDPREPTWLGILQQAREKRPRPLRDDKILTAWNGLMISALAQAYQTWQDPQHLRAAQQAASFILNRLYDPTTHRLSRHYREGASKVGGFLEDYAFLSEGLLDLYESDFDSRWLLTAFALTDSMLELFWDSEAGGFFSSSGTDPALLVRLKEDYDGAVPAPASVAASNLVRLAQLDSKYEKNLPTLFSISAAAMKGQPTIQPRILAAMLDQEKKPVQILIAGERGKTDTQNLLQAVFQSLPLHRILFLADEGPAHQRLKENQPAFRSLSQIEGQATAYICEDYVCKLPTNNVKQVTQLLQDLLSSALRK